MDEISQNGKMEAAGHVAEGMQTDGEGEGPCV